MLRIFVPYGKTLKALKGNYVFKGPTYAYLDGKLVLPPTFTDGSAWQIEKEVERAPDVPPQTESTSAPRIEDTSSYDSDSGRDEEPRSSAELDSPVREFRWESPTSEEG